MGSPNVFVLFFSDFLLYTGSACKSLYRYCICLGDDHDDGSVFGTGIGERFMQVTHPLIAVGLRENNILERSKRLDAIAIIVDSNEKKKSLRDRGWYRQQWRMHSNVG